jgi:anaerobic magnesium-protoporphyrin IX monomethyl ester cyclase
MNTLFLNLPHALRVTRRYMCSYESPTSLFPPLELMTLAAIHRQVTGSDPLLLDAIAKPMLAEEIGAFCKVRGVGSVVCLIGFECFEEDLDQIARIKQSCPGLHVTAFGHYPTLFADEILVHSGIDLIIKGEPDRAYARWIGSLASEEYRLPHWQKRSIQESDFANALRVRDYDALPMPAYHLIDHRDYFEPMMPRPFSMIQSARGCPYACNYCVRSFGKHLTLQSAQTVIGQLSCLKEQHGIKAFRFIDDTFTVQRKRVLEICKEMIARGLGLEWTCLSRTDNVDEEMLRWMKQAGCRRIYFGIESGSQRILEIYEKGLSANDALQAVKLTRACGIEAAGFFMLGLPEETEEDFLMTKTFIREARFDYLAIGGLVLYPGTPLYDRYRDQVEFSLFPYVHRFFDVAVYDRYLRWKKEIYLEFYTSRAFVGKFAKSVIRDPLSLGRTVVEGANYALAKGSLFHRPM